MKKTLAILLAAVMLLAMSAVAMAATPTGNITVNKVENGAKEFKAHFAIKQGDLGMIQEEQ